MHANLQVRIVDPCLCKPRKTHQPHKQRKNRSDTWMCTFTNWPDEIHLSQKTRANKAIWNPKWAVDSLSAFRMAIYSSNLTHSHNFHFGLARFDDIHTYSEWSVSVVVKVTDKIWSKWVLNELAFNNAKYAKPVVAFFNLSGIECYSHSSGRERRFQVTGPCHVLWS